MAQDLGPVSDPLKVLIEALKAFLSPGTTTLVIAAVVVLVLFKYFGLGKQIAVVYRWLTTRTDKRRAARRARFADHIESQMRRLGEKEEWRDHRYAELEAELEITGRQRSRFLTRASSNPLKRVSSLSKALEECEDRIVLLEGEPGSGKSVALRHLTQRLAGKAMRRPSEHSVIPIYVNLKTFVPAERPTSADIRAFVIASVNAVRDRDVERFLEEEFDRGMQEGTWLFLFDSFDEIPEILSATEADEVIEGYADAVHAFLHAMNKCRGVVASREFRGPGRAAWPTFRTVALSDKRKKLLVRRAELPSDIEDQLLGELPNAETGVRQMSGNPLFLGLLCEHMREGNAFPLNVHAVLETYIGHRLGRDAELLRGHFDVGSKEVRAVAEELAFLIADRQSLGLDVPKAKAIALLAESTLWSAGRLERAIEALIYTKIARTGENDNSVTFSHRRLQEYFATCVVIRDPDRVPARTLLTSGRWRETAVTILQTQEAEQAAPLLAEALSLLPDDLPEPFDWQPGLLYLLGVMAEGGAPASERAGALLEHVWENGRHFDRKWALEVCSVADTETCRKLLASGFKGDSEWLRQEAFAQLRRVPQLADGLEHEIRKTLVDLSVGGRLRRERRSVQAQLRRTPNPAPFERAMRLLLAGPFVHAAIAVPAVFLTVGVLGRDWLEGFVYLIPVVWFYFIARLASARTSILSARLRELVPWLESDEAWLLIIGLPLVPFVAIPFDWLVTAWRSDQTTFFVGLAAILLLFITPFVVLGLARGQEQVSWREVVGEAKKILSTLPNRRVVVIGISVGAALVTWLFDDSEAWIGLLALGILILGLTESFVFVGSVGRIVGQRRRVRAFCRLVRTETPSMTALRTHLLGLRDANAACEVFTAMHQKDAVWPDDVLAYLDRVAIAMETRDFASEDLPPKAKRRAWVRSSDVLDQLSIFLSAQRSKAAATPR